MIAKLEISRILTPRSLDKAIMTGEAQTCYQLTPDNINSEDRTPSTYSCSCGYKHVITHKKNIV